MWKALRALSARIRAHLRARPARAARPTLVRVERPRIDDVVVAALGKADAEADAALARRPRSGNERRRHPRHARGIPCEVFIQATRYSGIVENISRGGMFVQTRARAMRANAGVPVTIVVAPGQEHAEIRVTGKVARMERSGAYSAAHSTTGIGVEVPEAGSLGRLFGLDR